MRPITKQRIPITKTYFGPEELASIQQPLQTGWVVQGPYVASFEKKFSEYTAAPYSVATSSCTTALHIAVAVLGLKPGDEVIVPAFTWVATANVVEYMGATPIFCDIQLESFNIDPFAIESLITPKTVGIIPVHLFGLCADMDIISKLAAKHNLWVIEDAACGLGARYRGKHCGLLGDIGCFSFHPRKSITTGEGGMITTTSRQYDQLSRSLRDHGATTSDLERHSAEKGFLLSQYPLLGYNYRMTDIQGALGCAQMDRVEWILNQRKNLARAYDEALASLDWLKTPKVPDGFTHGYQAYVCMFSPKEPSMSNIDRLSYQRNEFMGKLAASGIATRQGTHAAALQKHYVEKYRLHPEMFPNAYFAQQLSLALPLYPQMTEKEQEVVVEEISALN